MPSRVDRRDDRDGLPNVVLEAMASGRAIVASDVAAIGTAVIARRRRACSCRRTTPTAWPPRSTASPPTAGCAAASASRARAAAVADHDLAACGHRFVDVIADAYREPGVWLSGAVAYVLKGYPRRSELFIASEIWRLEQLGVRAPPDRADARPTRTTATPSSTRCAPCRGTCRR